MIEFALVAPLFFMTVFLVLEGALYVNAVATVDNATREAARVAAVCGAAQAPSISVGGSAYSSCSAAVYGAVGSHMGFLPYTATGTNPRITFTGPAAAGSAITVTVVYTYSYYLNSFLGRPPTTDVTSTATVVSQQ